MTLTLRVHTYMNEPPGSAVEHYFSSAGGTIGRDSHCDLVLPDPEKRVSRTHARIQFEGGSYYFTDVGSNASSINGQALTVGQYTKMVNGDRVKIGEYVLQVACPVGQDSPGLGIGDRDSKQIFPLADPLAESPLLGDGLGLEGSYGLREHDPLGLGVAGGMGATVDPLLAAAIPPPEAPVYRGSESDHVPAVAQALPDPGAPFVPPTASQGGIPDEWDPLSDTTSTSPNQAQPGMAHRQSPPHVGSVTDPVYAALMRGLGIAQLDNTLSAAQMAERVGVMLRLAVSGTMEVLASRAIAKRTSRVEMTTIGANNNNPLKFLPDVDAALRQLLGSSQVGFMPPEQSLLNAFDDIKAHEIAMLAGMRAALTGVLSEFDPQTIEARLVEKGGLGKILTGGNKGKLWDQFSARYGELSDQADTDFERVFGEYFARAYQEQLDRIERQ